MSNTNRKYDLAWMPSLLRLCMNIQMHAERLYEAKAALENRISQIEMDLEEVYDLDKKISLSQDEVNKRLSEADQAEAKYATFREGIMSRMMDAARAGESIDLEEAGRLVELEVDRNLKVEQARQAKDEVGQLKILKIETERGVTTTYKRCNEIDNLHHKHEEALRHLGEVIHLLGELSMDAELVHEQCPGNALKTFSEVIESYSGWAITTMAKEDELDTIKTQKKQLESTLGIATIDSSALFSEICIALATYQQQERIAIPDQEPFTGDLTEY
jgi:hypothetical protein